MSPSARRKIQRGQSIPGAAAVSRHGRGETRDAVVVGSGPNGLAAAIALASAGWSVVVREAADVAGGGVRSGALTLPGYLHDLGSTVHPLAVSSPFFRQLPLATHGLEWVQPPIPLAHPMDDAPPVLLHRSLDETAAGLGRRDGARYRTIMGPLVDHWSSLCDDLLAPVPPVRWPRHPLLMAWFGGYGVLPAASLARMAFSGAPARALFAGLAAHSIRPLTSVATAAFALVLGAAGHAVGWPFPRGGSVALSNALVAHLRSLGGTIETSVPVATLADLPASSVVLLDLSPRQLLALAGSAIPRRTAAALARFRCGPGAFKLDWALSEPIPWREAACAQAATVHIGGSLDEMVESEAAPWQGRHADRPFVLLVQSSLFDALRAPAGRHTAWAYCHVPNGSSVDMTARIEAQIERFAPGFRDVVLARSVLSPAALQAYDANLLGGDIAGGANSLRQLMFRPMVRRVPYETGMPGVYLCSASTPPGAGVHGMCGYHAAQAVMAAFGGRR